MTVNVEGVPVAVHVEHMHGHLLAFNRTHGGRVTSVRAAVDAVEHYWRTSNGRRQAVQVEEVLAVRLRLGGIAHDDRPEEAT